MLDTLIHLIVSGLVQGFGMRDPRGQLSGGWIASRHAPRGPAQFGQHVVQLLAFREHAGQLPQCRTQPRLHISFAQRQVRPDLQHRHGYLVSLDQLPPVPASATAQAPWRMPRG